MTGWFSPFLFYLARCTENELRRQNQLLQEQLVIARTLIPKQRIFLKQEQKERLLKLGAELGPHAHKSIVLVHPRTYQRWVQEKRLGKKPQRMGRPKTLESVREIVIRIAKETGWGYGRILGELRKLRIHAISRSTIKNILKEAGMHPRPRGGQGTWNEFLKMHAETLWQIDFFSKCIWTPQGLRQCFVLAFIHLGTRRVYVSPSSFKPDAKWMERQAEAFLEHDRSEGMRVDYVIRDRDGKYITGFDAALKNAGTRVIPTAAHAPNQNAFIERWIKSIKYECLNHFIIFGQRHFGFLVTSYVDYYNTWRPHLGVDNRPLSGSWPDRIDPLEPGEQVVCHSQLSGLLRHYERRAA